MKQQARLREWTLCRYCGGAGLPHLHGKVYGHPRFADGEEITTSRLLSCDELWGIAETLNTVYILRDTEVDGDVQRTTETAA